MSAVATKYTVNLGSVDRIPLGEGRQFQVGDELISVFRTRNGEIFATQALCPHKSGPLADGLLGDRKILCPLHAYAFDLSSGLPLGHNCGALKTFAVAISVNGDVIAEID